MEEVFCVSYLCGTCGALDFSIILNGKQGKTLSDVFRLYCKFFLLLFFFLTICIYHWNCVTCSFAFCIYREQPQIWSPSQSDQQMRTSEHLKNTEMGKRDMDMAVYDFSHMIFEKHCCFGDISLVSLPEWKRMIASSKEIM